MVIDGAGPGVLDALGAGHEAAADLGRLIWCSITPFGLTGPWRDRPTNDLVSMALGGTAMMNGYDDHEQDAAGDLHDPRYEALLTTSPLEAGELRAEFGQTVMRLLRSRPVDEVYRRGQAIDMAWARVRAPEDNLDDPHWEDREFFVGGECPASTARSATLAPATSSRARPSRCAVARRCSASTTERHPRTLSGQAAASSSMCER